MQKITKFLLRLVFASVLVLSTVYAAQAQAPATIATVTASSFQDPHAPANTIDGDMGTRWSAQGDGQWIQFDFGALQQITAVRIAWNLGDTRQANFDIEASLDAQSWVKVFSGQSSGTTTDFERFDTPTTLARFARIVNHGNTSNDWASINEVEILRAANNDLNLIDKAMLSWDLPTMTLDNQPITGNVYIKLYQCDAPIADNKTCPGNMQIMPVEAANPTVARMAYRTTKDVGWVFIRAVAHLENQRESDLSNEVSVPFDVRTVPMPPANLSAE